MDRERLSSLEPDSPRRQGKACDKMDGKTWKHHASWSWVATMIMWFIVFTVLFWLILYSLKPSFVLQKDNNQADTAKVLLASVIAALILIFIIWLLKFIMWKMYKLKKDKEGHSPMKMDEDME